MVTNGTGRSTSDSPGHTRIDRRAFLKATGAGTLGTAIAGCTGGNGGGGGSSEGLKIGFLGPMESPLGIGAFRSAEMAVAEINEEDDVNEGEIEVLRGNTQRDPEEAQGVAEELIGQDDVDLLVGAFASEVALALIDLTADRDVPFLVTGSASPQVTRDNAGQDYETYKNVFRVGPINSDFQAEAMAGYCGYLRDHHDWDQLAFLRDNATWTSSFEDLLPDYLEERDIDIVYDEALSIENPDLSSVMDEIADTEANYILRFFAHIDGSPMLGNWHQSQYEFGIEGIHVTGMFPGYYAATEGVAQYETTAQTGAAGVTAITEKTIPFVEAYREQFGDAETPPNQAPMYMGFSTYDAIHITADVTNDIGESPRADLDQFVEAMLEVDHTGVSGQAEFYGPDSEYPHDLKEIRDDEDEISNYPVTQWQEEGELECVYPEEHRTAEHIVPAWMN